MSLRGRLVSLVQALIGGANRLASINADGEDTINLFVESTDPGAAKTPKYLRGTPGVRPFVEGPEGPIRAEFAQDGRAFAVAGGRFMEVFTGGTGTDYGGVANDDLPACMVSNGTAGNQVFIVSGGYGYIFDLVANVLTLIADPDFPNRTVGSYGALSCEFIDGYFIVLIGETRRFQISALEDGTAWDALDVAEISEASDNIVAMKRNHREIWFLGSKSGEVWYDNGDPLFPFAPIQGVFIENGAVAPFGICRAGNTLLWIDQDERGNGVVRRADGYTPVRTSTTAVETDFATSADLAHAQLFAQTQQGHLFVWFYLSDLEWTWCYDVTENSWHKRALWNPITCQWEPYVGQCHMFAFGKHLLGSRVNATIYELSSDYLDDQVVAA